METKVCSKCGKEKDIKKFNWKNKSKGYKCPWCKKCMKEYHEKYYKDNVDYQRERSKQRYKDNKEYHNEFMKQWREDNKEYYKEYRQNNREQLHKNNRKWKKNNPEQCKEYNKQYKINNKDKGSALEANRRAKKINQTPTNADREKIMFMYQIAHKMTKKCGVEYQVDHIKPLSKGGLHHENNLQILSRSLNLKKASKWPLTKEEKMLYVGIAIKDLKNEGE